MDVRILRSISLFFLAAGLFSLVSFALAVAGADGPLTTVAALGALLYKSFHLAGVYVPIYLLVLGIVNWQTPVGLRSLTMLSLGFIPAVLLGLTLRLMFTEVSSSPFPGLMHSQFGASGSVMVSGALALFSFVFVVLGATFSNRTKTNAPADRPEAMKAQPVSEVTEPRHSEEAAVQAFRQGVAGLLESKLDTRPVYPDLDTPPPPVVTAETLDEEDEEEAIAEEREPQPVHQRSDELAVYFSKDGFISDYPPQAKARWTTVVADEVEDVEIDEVNSRSSLATATATIEREAPIAIRADEIVSDDDGMDAKVDTKLLPPLPANPTWANNEPYGVPIAGVLDDPENKEYWLIDQETTRAAAVLKDTLQEFGIQAEVTGIRKGPVITMFEILPAHGVKLNRIVNLSDNIALRLAAQSVRIVAPIPGKHAVGIEIPNRDRAKVSFSELLAAESFRSPKMEVPVALGKDITGDSQIIDLARTPHLLIAGSTGSGKSVCVNALICSILYRRSPAEVNLILIDPKIVELKFYNDIPHLLTPVITDPKKAFQALQWCLYEMERRYSLLDAMQVRDIKSYNRKVKAKKIATPHLPYLVVVIDEFADLMATSGKELEATLARLAAMSRAVGIHLVLATQRPSTDVITGLIKANIPSRIAFMVASKIDSRIIIDSMGAEKLLGKGDMLFTSAWDPFPLRLQGAFLSEDEVERVVAHVKTLGQPDYIDDEIFFDAEDDGAVEGEDYEGAEDPLMQQAVEIVVSAKKASASYLQRRLKIGYNRAARMVEVMEDMGIVGPPQGSKPREILRQYQ